MKKIPKKYSGLLLGAIGPIVMGFIMAFVITFINIGFVENFFSKWIKAYFGALVFGLPIGMVVIPPLKSFVDKITE